MVIGDNPVFKSEMQVSLGAMNHVLLNQISNNTTIESSAGKVNMERLIVLMD